MVLFNYSTKELTAKVVYYGPGLCGKTTNLQWIHEKLPIKNKGKMLSLATETDRTLFFDFLPIELGSIRGMKTRIQLYTVPGQVFYNATRRMVLKGADCVVFVCDSQEAMLDANLESLENLRQNLEANEIDADEIPMVLQYNKRDLPNALPVEILNEKLNPRGLPFYEAVAVKGQGVEETLKGVTATVFRSLASKYGGATGSLAAPEPPRPAPSAAPPAPAPRPAAAPPPVPAAASVPAAAPTPTAPRPVPAVAAAAVAAPPVIMGEELLDSLDAPAAPAADAMAELGLEDPPGGPFAEPEEIELEELAEEAAPPPGPRSHVALEPELSLEAIEDEEIVEEDEIAPAPSYSALDDEAPRAPSRGTVTTAPVSVELTAVSGSTDIAIPVDVSLDNGATVHLQIRVNLNLNLRR
jgi:signal recognition particle receptor subunit beta